MRKANGTRRRVFAAALGAILGAGAGAANAQITNFSRDVDTAIDRSLRWMDAANAFANPSSASDGAGLVALVLLEKRASADPNAPPVGYLNARPADKARMDAVVGFILDRSVNNSFFAYRDGADLMALSVYLRTGGPRGPEALAAIGAIFDRIAANQGAHGYWCYTDGSCPDSSTTQLVMAGLASVKGVFSDPATSDPARLATLQTLTANVRGAYTMWGLPGDVEPDTEKCHGYQGGGNAAPCSLQQTASGMWGQIIGGADLNDPSVQGYLRYLRNHYNYITTQYANGGWNSSYQYFLWSSSKGFKFLKDSGVPPAPGNLGVDDLGMLAPEAAPAFLGRLAHRDPATDTRLPLFGAEGAGYYDAPNLLRGYYYDYAYTLLGLQDETGYFGAGPGNSNWDAFAEQAYSVLVLERSLGGGCADTDADGVCDTDDRCPSVANQDQADGDGDGVGDVCDNCPLVPNGEQADADGDGTGDLCEGCPENPRPEICNGVDDDCDGQVDEELGRFTCATGMPGLCAAGRGACQDGAIVCEPVRPPLDEICNGVDDNCDGHADEGVRNACGTCDATVPAETCDGVDNDCDGVVDDEAPCAPGERCAHGVCEDPCADVQCPDGYVCDEGFCVDLCIQADCARGQNCQLGVCIDPCEGVSCEAPLVCFGGNCVANDCLATGCADGERCRDVGCEQNPCAGVVCEGDAFCRDGICVPSCAWVACNLDQRCEDGACVPDLCYGVECPEGLLCRSGECRADLCGAVECVTGRTCVDGTCVIDACADTVCPFGQRCVMQSNGQAQCADSVTPVEPPLPDMGVPATDAGPAFDGGVPPRDLGPGADIGSGQGDASPGQDGGQEGTGGTGGSDSIGSDGNGCSCNVGEGGPASTGLIALLLAVPGLALRRRRR